MNKVENIHEMSGNGHDFFRDEATATPAHSGPAYTKRLATNRHLAYRP